jgi:hypothetical protein
MLLYSPGLGLAIASAAAMDALRAGTDDPGSAEQLVRVHTGSPQIFYDLHFHLGELPGRVRTEGLGTASVGLRIRGAALAVRDGYDLDIPPEQWEGDEGRWAVPDGAYRLELAYSRQRQPDCDIALYLALVPDEEQPHRGDVDLFLPPPGGRTLT